MRKDVRTFSTTSAGRLFDAAAALLGFTREITFEGQAAMWLEQLARSAACKRGVSFSLRRRGTGFPSPASGGIQDRLRGRDLREIARAFQRGIAQGLGAP